ncbi:MAG TPA: ribosome biogenesis GTP-binding protein YihA/YsxC [Oscillospiraceae bacterium]|nr:ribosome biogenesis GTP-binding protein YihA/YsxC [Oscillospiraceae bacterium]
MNFNKAEFYISYGKYSQIPQSDRIEIAFAGRSNVGKSSLINKIFNRKSLAKVSSVPGKTATINFYKLEDIYLVDLPGYGYAKIAKSEKERWSGLIEGYLTADRDIALIFQLVDMRHPPTNDDIHMMNFLIENELPFVIVLTKSDKLSNRQKSERIENLKTELPFFEEVKIIEFSSLTGEGTEEIRKIIEEVSKTEEHKDTE